MLDEAKDDLFNLRFQSVIGQLDNNSLLKQTRKEVARLLTELRMREIAQTEAPGTTTVAATPANKDASSKDAASKDATDLEAPASKDVAPEAPANATDQEPDQDQVANQDQDTDQEQAQ